MKGVFNIGFFKFIESKNNDRIEHKEVPCEELYDSATEYKIRELCFDICVNMIANALARCEFKTYHNHKEEQQEEYWLWNFEPNANQNASVFLHELIDKLYRKNEVLVIDAQKGKDKSGLVVADSWVPSSFKPTEIKRYNQVTVGEYEYPGSFKENEVLHLKLNNSDIEKVRSKMTGAYEKTVKATLDGYEWSKGQHWKVHVDSMSQAEKDFEGNFAKMVSDQLKPFFGGFRTVLPEFDGFNYTNETSNIKPEAKDHQEMIEDIFNYTARAFLIPAVLINGKVEATADANNRFLTYVIDPLVDQLNSEINRKRYKFKYWSEGTYLHIDSSSIIHFDLFGNAASVEKLVGSGAFTINGILKAAGQAPINEEWANEHYMTKNIGTVRELTNQKGGTSNE